MVSDLCARGAIERNSQTQENATYRRPTMERDGPVAGGNVERRGRRRHPPPQTAAFASVPKKVCRAKPTLRNPKLLGEDSVPESQNFNPKNLGSVPSEGTPGGIAVGVHHGSGAAQSCIEMGSWVGK